MLHSSAARRGVGDSDYSNTYTPVSGAFPRAPSFCPQLHKHWKLLDELGLKHHYWEEQISRRQCLHDGPGLLACFVYLRYHARRCRLR